jgi:hypothetical protein
MGEPPLVITPETGDAGPHPSEMIRDLSIIPQRDKIRSDRYDNILALRERRRDR